ncbi:HlyD family secretion protein [Sunxiuqinia sp. sy24]|uniref:HlyD family secretion protein n=1 Tax=Sunxiuqinia sp. sy24 TaxID=3461495 RepID=UPI00404613F8
MGKNTTKKNKSLSKKRIVIANLSLFLLISVLIVWGIREYFHLGDAGYTNDAQIEEYISPVNSKVQGYIKYIGFDEHQHVSQGDTLLILDDSEYQIRLAQAEAAYLNALAAQEVTESSIQTIRNNLSVSDANIQASQSRLLNLEKNYTRYQNLYQDEVVTKAQLENVETEYEALKSQIKAMTQQRKSIQFSIQEVQKRLKINEAQIKSANAAFDMAKLNVEYCTVIAPYDCTAGRQKLQVGQLIQPGQQLLSIVKSKEQWVVANFKERQMPVIAIGKKVRITVDALNDKEYEGVIKAISYASGAKFSAIPVDNSTGNFVKVQQRFPVRIEFTDANSEEDVQQLRAGMNVIVSVID